MDFYLREENHIVARILLQEIVDGIIGACVAEQGADDGQFVIVVDDTRCGCTKCVLPVNAQNTGDGGFTGDRFGEFKVICINSTWLAGSRMECL